MEQLDPFEVYPRAAKIEAVALLGGRATVAARDVTAAAAGQSLLFRGVRDFAAGDDVRRIHWPATARRGSPMVRENERDLQPVFTLFLDLERRGRAGLGRKSTLEYLVRVGASLLWTAHRRGDAFGLVAEADRPIVVPPAQGEGHLAAVLHQLVIAKQTGTRPLVEVVERNRDFAPPGAAAALLLSTTEVDLDALASHDRGAAGLGVPPLRRGRRRSRVPAGGPAAHAGRGGAGAPRRSRRSAPGPRRARRDPRARRHARGPAGAP